MRGSTSSSYRTPSIVMLTLVIRPPRRPTWADALSFPQAHLRAKPRTTRWSAPVPARPARRGTPLAVALIRMHAGPVGSAAISVGTLRLPGYGPIHAPPPDGEISKKIIGHYCPAGAGRLGAGGRPLLGGPRRAIASNEVKERTGRHCLGTEDTSARPGARVDQLQRDHRVDRGLPDHGLGAVLGHRPRVVDHVVQV